MLLNRRHFLLHEAAGVFAGGPANGQAIYLQRWNAHAHRHSLPILATGAYAFVQLQIIAYHADARQNIGTVADQRSAFDRGGNLAVFDHVGFACREDEFTVRNVDLPTTEIYSVDAVLH